MPGGGTGVETAAALDADAADLSSLATALSARAEAMGTALSTARTRVAGLADHWSGNRATGLIEAGTVYLDEVAPVVGALESAASTASAWSTLAADAADDVRRWQSTVDSLESEAARGIEYPGQGSDLLNARSRLSEIREQWRLDSAAKAEELAGTLTALDLATYTTVAVSDVSMLSDDWYYPALSLISVQTGIDLATLDPTGRAAKAAAERAEWMGTEAGAAFFLIFDTANQGDLDKADGNLSTHDIEAASDPARVEALLRQAAEAQGFEWDPAELSLMVSQITATAWMMRADPETSWEDVDDEVGLWDTVTEFTREHVFAPVVAFGVGALCYSAAAVPTVATGGAAAPVSAGAAGFCGGLSAAAGSAAQRWANGEGLDGALDGFTDPRAWAFGGLTGMAFQGATNYLLRPPSTATVFRGDGRIVDDIFDNGFSASQPSMPLAEHLAGGNGLVSTSRSQFVADGFAVQHRGVTYIIDDVGGTPVQYSREFWHLRGEQEVVFSRIIPSQIRGAVGPNGVFVPNPGYIPQTPVAAQTVSAPALFGGLTGVEASEVASGVSD